MGSDDKKSKKIFFCVLVIEIGFTPEKGGQTPLYAHLGPITTENRPNLAQINWSAKEPLCQRGSIRGVMRSFSKNDQLWTRDSTKLYSYVLLC